MITLIALGVWLAGALAALRPMLRRRMLRPACELCRDHWMCSCNSSWYAHVRRARRLHVLNGQRWSDAERAAMLHKINGIGDYAMQRVVRGSRFDRDGHVVSVTVCGAATRPVWLPSWLIYRVAQRLVSVTVSGVIAAVPLTGPELERKIKERDAEIERLTREIEDH